MGILLWVLGTLALGAGAIKLRGRTRVLVGRSPLAVAEIGAGVALVAGAGLGLGRTRPLAWLAVGVTLVLIVASAVAHGRRLARATEARERSAERRLRQYLEVPDR